MADYYFDIETTGLNPKEDKIITIQYMELDKFTGMPKKEMVILKEWESSEKEILEKFREKFLNKQAFDFVPIGKALEFNFRFIIERNNSLFDDNYISYRQLFAQTPSIDIKPILILINSGKFTGYQNVLGEQTYDSSKIIEMYKNKEYEKIENAIKAEANEFLIKYRILRKELPKIQEKFEKGEISP
ncbi:MAG: hypothetical protein JXA43_00375 [Candidatus Diapherotrites archaeon]|nr:hypothetical protein [Candidatus Diapherotrites archaeon]